MRLARARVFRPLGCMPGRLSPPPVINSIANTFVKEKGCRGRKDDVARRSTRPLSLSLSLSLSRPLCTVHLARFLCSFFFNSVSLRSALSSPLSSSPNKSLHSARADLVPSPPAVSPSLTAHLIPPFLHPSRLTLPLGGLRSASHVHLLRRCTQPAPSATFSLSFYRVPRCCFVAALASFSAVSFLFSRSAVKRS